VLTAGKRNVYDCYRPSCLAVTACCTYLTNCRGSPLIGEYQIILHGDRGTCIYQNGRNCSIRLSKLHSDIQGSSRTSQVGFQDFDFSCTFVVWTFVDLVRQIEVLIFLTRSTLPSRHIVMEHCTNFYVILHLMYSFTNPSKYQM